MVSVFIKFFYFAWKISGSILIVLLLPTLKLSGSMFNIRILVNEQRLELFYNLVCGRIPKAIRVNNLPLININTELTKSAFDGFYLYVVFFTQLGCHTGSRHLLDRSNKTIMN